MFAYDFKYRVDCFFFLANSNTFVIVFVSRVYFWVDILILASRGHDPFGQQRKGSLECLHIALCSTIVHAENKNCYRA